MNIIEVQHLSKSYGDVPAVCDISFSVERGKLFAFLGPNGAGKSTTIDIICTFLQPDSGTVVLDGHVLGKDDDAIRRAIGVVFQDHLLDPLLTVRENLSLRGRLYGMHGKELQDAVLRAAKATGVEDILKRPYGKLSGGQKRRCDVARALLHTPKVLFLDEPTTGLDPQTRKSVWETIQRLQEETQMTIFLTTHYMEEAAAADDVVVIDEGRIAARGTPVSLRNDYASDHLRLTCADEEAIAEILAKMGIAYRKSAGQLVVALPDTLAALPMIDAVKKYLTSFEVIAGTMDDAFIGITGKEIRE